MDVVAKIGGSLLASPTNFKNLLRSFDKNAKKHSIVMVPGGGPFADQVRHYYSSFGLSDSTAHKMAIISEDIVALMINQFLEEGVLIKNLDEIPKAFIKSKIPIIMPSSYLLKMDELPHSWDVTSDSIAVYFAGKLGIKKVILVKDVDGLYTEDPKKDPSAKLVKSIRISELNDFKNSCVDRMLPNYLREFEVSCYLVNGNFPERISKILEGKDAIYSYIYP